MKLLTTIVIAIALSGCSMYTDGAGRAIHQIEKAYDQAKKADQ